MKSELIILVSFLLGCAACSAIRETATIETPCQSRSLTSAENSASAVSVLIAPGRSIPSGRWPRYRETALDAARCAPAGADFDVLAITDDPIATPPVYSARVPTPDRAHPLDSLVQYPARRRSFILEVAQALDVLPQLVTANAPQKRDSLTKLDSQAEKANFFARGSDAIGGLKVVGDGLAGKGGKKVLFVIFNGWQQSNSGNIFRYRGDPRRQLPTIVHILRSASAMPELTGVNVHIVGISEGSSGMEVSDIQMVELCGFWVRFMQAAGAKIETCAA